MQTNQSDSTCDVIAMGPSPQSQDNIRASTSPEPSITMTTTSATSTTTTVASPSGEKTLSGNLESKKIQLAEAHTRVYDAFSRAFSRQNTQFEKAIRSLDSLNDQIVEFVLSTGKDNEDNPKQRLILEPSVNLMKKLLLDAQGKFRHMVEENQQLASRIDSELQCAHMEVDVLRQDLADTNRRISEMQAGGQTPNRFASDSTDQNKFANHRDSHQLGIKDTALTGEQEFNHAENSAFKPTHSQINGTEPYIMEKPNRFLQEQILLLREENERLAGKNVSLLREVDELRYLKEAILKVERQSEGDDEGEGRDREIQHAKFHPHVTKLTLELTHAKEALSALKADRKRLKAEKFDLLNQMKQLYATLEDKERELRDFIRNYEQRMKESEDSLRQLTTDREENEREKWNLLKHAREEAERAVSLASQLGLKDTAVKRLEEELEMVRRHLSTLGYSSDAESVKANGPVPNSVFTPTSSPLPIVTPTPSVSTPTWSPLPLSNTNGRVSSADSGVKLSSDRDSTASHEVSCLTTALERNLNNGDSDGASICSSTATGASSTQYYYYYYGCGGGPGTPSKEAAGTIYSNPSLLRDESRLSLGARGERYSGQECSNEGKDTSSCTTPVNGTATFNHTGANNLQGSVNTPMSGSSAGTLSRSAEQLCERVAEAAEAAPKGRGSAMTLTRKGHKSGGAWGSISRVFARQKKRAALESTAFDGNPSDKRSSWSPGTAFCVSPLTEESYAEKLRLLEEAQHVPLDRWKAHTVLAWLEITLGMPQYGAMCAENVRSGKVLLELTDSELDTGLGITHALHRKKLRLAIEELRDPRRRRFPKISLLNHTWVATEWLPDLGLPQYTEIFASNLVDGRILENMSKKDLEKHLGVSRKFHQASIINGVHLLRIFRFDRQMLAEKRRQCEQVDCDPVVWTNLRFLRWAQSIDLTEYSGNLKESGVHGALVVLEHSFTAETMATALGIPSSKNIIRRHLATEFESLILPARRQMEEQARYAKIERRRQDKMSAGGSLGRSFVKNYETLDRVEKDKRRTSLRGSLSRAFGIKVRDEMLSQQNGSNEPIYSNTRSILSSGPPPAQSGLKNSHQAPQGWPYVSHVPYGTSQGVLRSHSRYGASPPSSVHLAQEGGPGRPRSSVVPSSVAAFSHRENHRRVRSIGDIEHITVTPV